MVTTLDGLIRLAILVVLIALVFPAIPTALLRLSVVIARLVIGGMAIARVFAEG